MPDRYSAKGEFSATSQTLLHRARSRESEAWNRLVEMYGPLIFGRVCRKGLQAEDAADVTQEVLAAVALNLGTFRGHRPGAFRAWLWTITESKVSDHFRRLSGVPRGQGGTEAQLRLLQVPESANSSDHNVPPNEEGAFWNRALECVRPLFNDRTWQAFWQVVVLGRSPTDVAVELKVTVAVVYQSKSRVLRQLRLEFSELENLEDST